MENDNFSQAGQNKESDPKIRFFVGSSKGNRVSGAAPKPIETVLSTFGCTSFAHFCPSIPLQTTKKKFHQKMEIFSWQLQGESNPYYQDENLAS
jgi:hypothetical protein